MAEFIKKFANPAAADQYAIKDIPFITSVDGDPIQNLVCNEEGKKLVSVGGIIEVQSATPTIEMVDLGLTSGTLWAKTNIGAQSETEAGLYFAWGETAQHEGWLADKASHPYSWNEYAFGSSSPFTKYDTDGKTVLEATDDVATVVLGAGYKMPTKAQFEELIEETNNEWTTINGVSGYKFTNKSDSSKYIFLPAAGYCNDSNLGSVGREGDYWSSSLFTGRPDNAWSLCFGNGIVYTLNNYRFFGFSIRPIQHVS